MSVRLSLERRRRELMQLIQRVQRSGPYVVTVRAEARLAGETWPLESFSEAIELAMPLHGFTGCDVRYRREEGQLYALFVFRAQRPPTQDEQQALLHLVDALPQPRKLPRLLRGHTLHITAARAVSTDCLTPEQHADEQERAKQQFSRIDAEIDAQMNALPEDTVQEARDAKLLANARDLMRAITKRADVTLDGSLDSLQVCTHIVGGLGLLDHSQQYMGLQAERYSQLALVACAVYVADVVKAVRPECNVHLQFNETGALREVEVVDPTDDADLRILRVLTLCMKCVQSMAEHDLRRHVDAFLSLN